MPQLSFEELTKDRPIWIYARVSTRRQNVENQVEFIEKFVEDETGRKADKIFSEKVSGSQLKDRTALKKLVREAVRWVESGKMPPVVVVKEAIRWFRLPELAWQTLTPMMNVGVNLYAINYRQYTQTEKFYNPVGHAMINFAFSVGLLEQSQTLERISATREVAVEQGRNIGGQFNFKNNKNETIDWRKIVEYWPLWKEGVISMNKASKILGMSDKGLALQWKSGHKFRNEELPIGRLQFLQDNLQKEGRDLSEWINVVERIIKVGEKYGFDRKNESPEFRAVTRMSSGYLIRPHELLPPEDELSSVSEQSFKLYVDNPKDYISEFQKRPRDKRKSAIAKLKKK